MSKGVFFICFILLLVFITGSVWYRTTIDRPIRDKELENLHLNLDSLRIYATNQADTIFSDSLLVVNVWATWCKPCLDEIEDLNKFRKDLISLGKKNKNNPFKIKFLALTDENNETIADWVEMRKKDGKPAFEYKLIPKQKALIEYLMRKNLDKRMPPGKGSGGIPANIIIHHGEVKFFITGTKWSNTINMTQKIMFLSGLSTKDREIEDF